MDTNLLQTLVTLMQEQKANGGSSFNPSSLMAFGMLLTAVAPTLAAFGAYLKARSAESSSKLSLVNSAETKETAVKTEEEVKKIHLAVNSERSAMLEEVKQLTDRVLLVSKENETLKEKQRGMEMAKAVEGAVPRIFPTSEPLTQPGAIAAIKETTSAVKEVQEIVATEESVSELIKKLILVLESKKK